MPPIPQAVISQDGTTLYTREDIQTGRQVGNRSAAINDGSIYMQGLNLTPLHGHTALFGVYAFLRIGLMLFCLRGLKPTVVWNEGLLKTSFVAFNVGLSGMALTLLPIGVIQLGAAIDQGYWYARSADLMQQPNGPGARARCPSLEELKPVVSRDPRRVATHTHHLIIERGSRAHDCSS